VVEFLKGYKWVVHFEHVEVWNQGKGDFPNPLGLLVVVMGRTLIFMLCNVVLFFVFSFVHATRTSVIFICCFGCQN